MTTLTGRALKVTIVLDPVELLTLRIPDGSSRIILKIAAGGRTATADIAAKSLRKAQTTIREAGPAPDGVWGCAAIIQGKLGAGDVITEAGLVAQIKGAKDAAAPAAVGAPDVAPISPAEVERRRQALASLKTKAADHG